MNRLHRTVAVVHLASGLAALPFLAVYFVSGVEMAHRAWWRLPSRSTEQSFTLPRNLEAREVAHRLPVRGELASVMLVAGGCELTITRPGATYLASYSAATGETSLHGRMSGFTGLLIGLHRISGMTHGYAALSTWAGALALMSAALLALGASGLYLWWRNRAGRKIGIAVLAAGACVAVALIVSMRGG